MIFQIQPQTLTHSNYGFQNSLYERYVPLNENKDFQIYDSLSRIFYVSHYVDSFFKNRIMDLSATLNKNSEKTNEIMIILDQLQQNFSSIEKDFSSIVFSSENLENDLTFSHTCHQESFSTERSTIPDAKSNRTHPKIKLMEKIFGKKEYSYRLAFDGKFPKILFKQRNISLNILLKNIAGQNVINGIFLITTGNRISLNLKMYRNDGEQIVSDSPQKFFMQGVCQTQIEKGVGKFSKIHPKQVSRGFSTKGICIIIYATSQQNQTHQQGLNIEASQIQPLIFFNIKVVVKQNKMVPIHRKQNLLKTKD